MWSVVLYLEVKYDIPDTHECHNLLLLKLGFTRVYTLIVDHIGIFPVITVKDETVLSNVC